MRAVAQALVLRCTCVRPHCCSPRLGAGQRSRQRVRPARHPWLEAGTCVRQAAFTQKGRKTGRPRSTRSKCQATTCWQAPRNPNRLCATQQCHSIISGPTQRQWRRFTCYRGASVRRFERRFRAPLAACACYSLLPPPPRRQCHCQAAAPIFILKLGLALGRPISLIWAPNSPLLAHSAGLAQAGLPTDARLTRTLHARPEVLDGDSSEEVQQWAAFGHHEARRPAPQPVAKGHQRLLPVGGHQEGAGGRWRAQGAGRGARPKLEARAVAPLRSSDSHERRGRLRAHGPLPCPPPTPRRRRRSR